MQTLIGMLVTILKALFLGYFRTLFLSFCFTLFQSVVLCFYFHQENMLVKFWTSGVLFNIVIAFFCCAFFLFPLSLFELRNIQTEETIVSFKKYLPFIVIPIASILLICGYWSIFLNPVNAVVFSLLINAYAVAIISLYTFIKILKSKQITYETTN